MTITGIESGMRSVQVWLACLLMTGWLAAQSAPAKPARDSSLVDATASHPAAAATKPHDDTFVIGNDDVLAINVWKEPDVSRSIPVRPDGKISLPLAGEIQAAGLTPLRLEREIASKLQNYISEPEVTVMVQQINSEKFNILGQVAKPGSYPLTNSARVLDAIALAGGFVTLPSKNPFTSFAKSTIRMCAHHQPSRLLRLYRRSERSNQTHESKTDPDAKLACKVQARRPS